MAALALAAWAGEPGAAPPPADLVVLDATIHTAAQSPARAEAMAVRDGRIVAVGTSVDVRRYVGGSTQVLELRGRTVLPGLIDSHGHLDGLGRKLGIVDLVGTASYDEVIARVAARARETPAGEWVLGRGWDQNDWPDQALPHHRALSEATPDHPVVLDRVDGYAVLANRRALELAGIGRDTPDPPGGKIERDAAGEPNGVLVDAATAMVKSLVPPPTPEQTERRLLAAMNACAAVGLTMVHDAGIGRAQRDAYAALLERGTFPIRVYAMAYARDPLADEVLDRGPENGDRFTLRTIKVQIDGALGSRGALLGAPYADRPGHVGLETFPHERLEAIARRARQRGIQMRVHAIGDLGNALALDAYESAFGGRPQPKLRWAIEHAQVVRPADIRRFARLGVVASMQATHATSDGPWAEQRLGPERVKWSYAWRQFLAAGVPLANGSDFPVESPNPMLGLYASITRRDLDGRLPAAGWRPEERLTPLEALRSFTVTGAWLAFRERDLGTLEVGRLADFVVLDRDPIAGPAAGIPDTKVLRTVVGGVTVYEAPGASGH